MLRRDVAEARRVVDEALARWPDSPALLVVAINVAKRSGDFPSWLEHAERLLAIEPDNDALRQSYEVTKRMLKRS